MKAELKRIRYVWCSAGYFDYGFWGWRSFFGDP
jgi:hypothetical protein